MNVQMQNTTFTHAKCVKCGHLGKIENFSQTKKDECKSEGEGGMTMEFYQLVLCCPLCGDEFCEALFPNEVN